MVLLNRLDPYVYDVPIVVPPLSEIRLDSTTHTGKYVMVPGQQISFRDSGGTPSTYASNENYNYTFQGTSSGFRLEFITFQFEQYTSSQYDRLGITRSVDGGITYQNVAVPWMQTSTSINCPWSSSFGGAQWNSVASYNPGYILPATVARANTLGYVNGTPVVLPHSHIKFCFFSDSSSNYPGWDILITAL